MPIGHFSPYKMSLGPSYWLPESISGHFGYLKNPIGMNGKTLGAHISVFLGRSSPNLVWIIYGLTTSKIPKYTVNKPEKEI